MAHGVQLDFFDSPQSNVVEIKPDICRNRHKGNEHSEAANLRIEPHKASMRERIRVFVAACQDYGATIKDVCQSMGKTPNEISGRITELKRDKVLFDSGREREGCAVLVARKCWINGSERG